MIEKKEQIRKQALIRRRELPESLRREYSRKIAEQVIAHPLFLCAREIYCYVSYGTEVLTEEILSAAWRCRKKTAVPKVLGTRDMAFYYIRSLEELAPGSWNILEPAGDADTLAEGNEVLAILPGAAFDKCGKRVGYGKGYYDIYLRKHPGYHRIGIAFAAQCVEAIPAESHDIPVEFVVTERGILCQNNYQEIL